MNPAKFCAYGMAPKALVHKRCFGVTKVAKRSPNRDAKKASPAKFQQVDENGLEKGVMIRIFTHLV
ncbi:MAG TPA: hypothetical protein VFA40_24670 [Terriglobales bacterium]|nr:hypothetical protein [Terriglobales bacterium]